MIRVVLLTGFLGAGKTTLLQNLMEAFQDRKFGIIVNEFGSVSIDGALIHREGIQMAELSNGSIFCACIKDKFVDSLIEMSGRDLELLFIEASGLADPSSMEQILAGILHKTGDRLRYQGAICIVDGETFEDLYDLLPAIHNQIEYSSVILINKADLLDSQKIGPITQRIQRVNPGSAVVITSYCRADYPELLDQLRKPEAAPRESSNRVETRPKTIILRQKEVLPTAGLMDFLEEVAVGTYRIKGFVMTDQGRKVISGVGKHLNLTDWEGPGEHQIVLISSVGIRLMSIITGAMEKHLPGGLSL